MIIPCALYPGNCTDLALVRRSLMIYHCVMSKRVTEAVVHTIPPFLQPDSRMLVLGSFPSVKSRQAGFYYGHPQNRFYRVLAAVFQDEVPDTVPRKMAFLKEHRVAVWDVVWRCQISGSSDASIIKAEPNNVASLVRGSAIERVLINGQQAASLYHRYAAMMPNLPCFVLPSTSAANASCSLERLVDTWKQALKTY